MRVLFSSTPGDGHIYPLLPLAQALKARNHDVAFATSTEHARVIEGGGFGWFPSGVTGDELNRRIGVYLTDLPPLTSSAYFPFVIEHRYALADTPDRLSDLETLTAEWRPDLIVFESCDLAAPIAAATRGVPVVHHSFGRALAAACDGSRTPRRTALAAHRDEHATALRHVRRARRGHLPGEPAGRGGAGRHSDLGVNARVAGAFSSAPAAVVGRATEATQR